MADIAKGVRIWFKQRLCGVNLCVLLKKIQSQKSIFTERTTNRITELWLCFLLRSEPSAPWLIVSFFFFLEREFAQFSFAREVCITCYSESLMEPFFVFSHSLIPALSLAGLKMPGLEAPPFRFLLPWCGRVLTAVWLWQSLQWTPVDMTMDESIGEGQGSPLICQEAFSRTSNQHARTSRKSALIPGKPTKTLVSASFRVTFDITLALFFFFGVTWCFLWIWG